MNLEKGEETKNIAPIKALEIMYREKFLGNFNLALSEEMNGSQPKVL
jgi:hypothetical protein